MRYSIDELANEYLKMFHDLDFDIDRPYLPDFNFDAYNDNEYLSCIKEIEKDYASVDDIEITNKFIEQNYYDDNKK